MSNVFTYPSDGGTNFVNPADSIQLGALKRANTFLNGGNNADIPYATGYFGNTTRMAGLPVRTPEEALKHVSRFRGYYGVASGFGLDGYPTYEAVYRMAAIYCYFHLIKFGITDAYPNPSTGTLTLECRRDHGGSHPTTVPFFATTDTHGMGDASFKYTDNYPLQFDLAGFDETVAGEWGNYLNFATNGGVRFFLKVIDAQKVEVYTNSNYATPVNIGPSGLNWSAYTSGGFAVVSATGQNGSFQLLSATLYDQGNLWMTYYDKDYYSGHGNSVNNDFGANLAGARPSFYVSSSSTSTSSYLSNPPIDYATVTDWQFNSQYNPDLTITTGGDGLPFTGSGTNSVITGVTFNVERAGRMMAGGTSADPYLAYSQCLVLPASKPSDPVSGFNFAISNITQASPAVVTFTNSVRDQSANGNANASKTFNGVLGMTEINGRFVYLKQISHNTAEVYTNAAMTTPFDTTGFTAYTSGGNLQDYDDNDFVIVSGTSFTGRDFLPNFQDFAPAGVDYGKFEASDQIWPRNVSPAKVDMTLIHPTRKTYAQDLTRYTNSTGAYGIRLSVTYNNISQSDWRIFDAFIKQMRGGSAPFTFHYFNNTDGGGYRMTDTSVDTIATWAAARPRLAKRYNPGDTSIYLTGFKADGSAPGTNNRIVSRTGDVFFNLHGYRSTYTNNNLAFAGGQFETNQFGEAIIRFTHPLKNSLYTFTSNINPNRGFTYFQCQLADDEVEFDWHPTGNFVSFTINMDVV